jgi:2-oxoisovalerate dehydrogenase E1 component
MGMRWCAACRCAIAAIRADGKPRFLECRAYRFRAHSMFDAQLYRDKAEVAGRKTRGPIIRFQTWLLDNGQIHAREIVAMEGAAEAEISDAVAFAQAAPREPVADLTLLVTANIPDAPGAPGARSLQRQKPPAPEAPVETTEREAVRAAIDEAMTADPRAFLLGEDVGAHGGCHAVSMGLMDKFGPDRIHDAPLSESGLAGAGIGTHRRGDQGSPARGSGLPWPERARS